MRRFSIGRLMLLVAFLGANFAALRFLMTSDPRAREFREPFAGLVPLADGLILSLYNALSPDRPTVCTKRRGERTRFAPRMAGLCALSLAVSIGICLTDPELYGSYLRPVGPPVVRFLRDCGVDTERDTPLLRYALGPAFLGTFMSGPPLLLSLGLATVLSRFQLAVTPKEEPCADSRSPG